MKKLTIEDIKPLPEYEPVRKAEREKIIELKRRRRISLGDTVTLVFENRETVRHQIQEMMRTEHIYDMAKIREEINTYNELIPEAGELSATLFIEITEMSRIQEILDGLQGIDSGKAVYLQIGEERTHAVFESGHSKEDKLSAVHYVRFPLSASQRKALGDPATRAEFVLNHPFASARTPLSQDIRKALLGDLKGSA